MNKEILYKNAKKLMISGKGILASDESLGSANKNLQKINVEPTDLNRQKYRELFINTNGIERYLSGIIIHDETFWQADTKGKLFRDTLKEKDIVIIIKVDEGTTEMPNSKGELITLGLDNLEDRLKKYYDNGARAAKWRAVIQIDTEKGFPTAANIDANATALAEYSLFCQKQGIVPIVEPEVLFDGNHNLETAEVVTKKTLNAVFNKLIEYNVDLKGVILKSSMVIPGKDNRDDVTPEMIAQATTRVFLETVPAEIPGIVFLSGGQGPVEATKNLNEIAQLEPLPWQLAFSFLRAIEGPAG